MTAGAGIEYDGPELADGILWPSGWAEDRIPDPERQRLRRMVGALKIAFVMAGRLSGPIARAIEVVGDH
jgi:hypothetical protein